MYTMIEKKKTSNNNKGRAHTYVIVKEMRTINACSVSTICIIFFFYSSYLRLSFPWFLCIIFGFARIVHTKCDLSSRFISFSLSPQPYVHGTYPIIGIRTIRSPIVCLHSISTTIPRLFSFSECLSSSLSRFMRFFPRKKKCSFLHYSNMASIVISLL